MARKKHEINPECGKRLKQWLDFAGLSAQTLCKAINYTPQYMSDIVTGKKRLTPDLANIIARVPEYYVDGETGEKILLDMPEEKRVYPEFLLCESDIMTGAHDEKAYYQKSMAMVSGISSIMQSHGYSIDTLDSSGKNLKEYNMIMQTSGRDPVDGVVKIKAPNGKELLLPHKQWVLFEDEISQYVKFKTNALFSSISVFSEYVVTKEVSNG